MQLHVPVDGDAPMSDHPEVVADGPAAPPTWSGRTARWWSALDRHGMRSFWVACALVLGVQLVVLVSYSAFLFHRFDLTDDFATYSQAWWNIGHGHLNPADTIQSPVYPFWQSHFELAMWPLAVLGRLWPHSVQLLWLQDAAIVGTEWMAMVWVAAICATRLERFRSTAAAVALLFLVANPWWYLAASFDIHFELLGLPFVAWSAYALWSGALRTALVVALVALLFGDVVAIAVLCVGIAGLASRRVRRQGGVRSALSIVVLSIVWIGSVTLLGANKGSGIVTNYGYLVNAGPTASSTSVVAHLLLHPGTAVHVLVDRHGPIGRVIASAGLLGVVTPWGLAIALGILVPDALNANTAFLSPTIAFQSIAVIPLVFVGTVMVLVRVGRGPEVSRSADASPTAVPARVTRWRGVVAVVVATAVVTVALIQNVPLFGTIRSDWWRVDASTAAVLRQALPEVPASAEVIASQGVIGRFADRTYVYPFVAAPQRFPVHAREVVFVITPVQGIESVSPTAARAAVASVTGMAGTTVLEHRNGVTVVAWRPPPGMEQITLPGG
jgi:uncharacterized membrane protein